MEQTLSKVLGDALRTARKAKGLTQEDAAERAGISFEFFGRIERGSTLPSVPTLVRLAQALTVSTDALLGLSTGQALGTPFPDASLGESADLRRLIRRMRRAHPRTVRLLAVLAAELERGAKRTPSIPSAKRSKPSRA